jgi:hypothetical protein
MVAAADRDLAALRAFRTVGDLDTAPLSTGDAWTRALPLACAAVARERASWRARQTDPEPPASDEPPAPDEPPASAPPASAPPASDEPPASAPPAPDEPPASAPPASAGEKAVGGCYQSETGHRAILHPFTLRCLADDPDFRWPASLSATVLHVERAVVTPEARRRGAWDRATLNPNSQIPNRANSQPERGARVPRRGLAARALAAALRRFPIGSELLLVELDVLPSLSAGARRRNGAEAARRARQRRRAEAERRARRAAADNEEARFVRLHAERMRARRREARAKEEARLRAKDEWSYARIALPGYDNARKGEAFPSLGSRAAAGGSVRSHAGELPPPPARGDEARTSLSRGAPFGDASPAKGRLRAVGEGRGDPAPAAPPPPPADQGEGPTEGAEGKKSRRKKKKWKKVSLL